MNFYRNVIAIQHPISAERQTAKRHYGVHPYFTRRPFNVVRDYILHYSRPGDRVIDPFGGSGVTAIEAFLENRIGVHNDLNPLANFIASGIADLAKGNLSDYRDALAAMESACSRILSEIEKSGDAELDRYQKQFRFPKNVVLPANSDVTLLYDLFEPKQLAGLAVIREHVARIPNKYARNAMLLAFSATLAKLNRTFLSAEGRLASRGGSSIFSIYRYKVAKKPVLLPLWPTFRERAINVLAAKAEVDQTIEHKRQSSAGWHGEFHAYDRDVLELPQALGRTADYIFTDPPYGGHIAYLDLSTMWNAWLGILPTPSKARHEIIVGGDRKHADQAYTERLGSSIRACLELLKPDRWLSVVFQHWNISYFQAILTSAADSGADLRAAVSQVGDPIWSMHKKKGSASVLAGELILSFFKTGKPVKYELGQKLDLESELYQLLQEMHEPLYGEALFNRIVLRAWRKGAINSLAISKDDFAQMLLDMGWQYDQRSHFWVTTHRARRLI
jgi:16S rRNA G966 N2-methylase RsmD